MRREAGGQQYKGRNAGLCDVSQRPLPKASSAKSRRWLTGVIKVSTFFPIWPSFAHQVQ